MMVNSSSPVFRTASGPPGQSPPHRAVAPPAAEGRKQGRKQTTTINLRAPFQRNADRSAGVVLETSLSRDASDISAPTRRRNASLCRPMENLAIEQRPQPPACASTIPPPSPRATSRRKSSPASRVPTATVEIDNSDVTDSEDENFISATAFARSLTCPSFYLRDPQRYRSRPIKRHRTNASDVRQLITAAADARPEHCPTCRATFTSEVACTMHIRSRTCQRDPHAAA
ncbi:hypothetical protein B0T22DRAFT_191030 [Podospora appendiculata]|uniref:Uncharacterized protein n=1 Tax=Podospora appendiculata TaxID=314037 RepID=A0AAE0XDF9_9PEZI|nr:hypothetical protein B0T22DRAFT_191030 [Podospora appendiculata]